MGSQFYVDEANRYLALSQRDDAGDRSHQRASAAAQVNATLAVAASIHDLISHLRGVTPCRPFDDKEAGQ